MVKSTREQKSEQGQKRPADHTEFRFKVRSKDTLAYISVNIFELPPLSTIELFRIRIQLEAADCRIYIYELLLDFGFEFISQQMYGIEFIEPKLFIRFPVEGFKQIFSI